MTKQKSIILEIINNSCEHLTAEAVYEKSLEKLPKIALATVYNNLNALTASGDIKRINMPDGSAHYDKTIPHDHMVCTVCHKITDVSSYGNYTDKKVKKAYEKATGENIIGYDLILYHVCGDCAKKR